MATTKEIEAILKLRDEFSSKIQVANKELKVINKHLKQVQGELGIVGKNTSFARLAGSILTAQVAMQAFTKAAAFLRSSIGGAIEFESSMTKLHTLVGLSTEEVKRLSGAVTELAGQTGKGPQELAEALYFIESAGLRGADAMEALTATAKASAVGLGDMATIADAVTSAVNAYGPSVLSASEATDVLLMTVREGKAAPEELASSIGQILPVAQQMGVSLQEVGAGVASLTRIGMKTSEAMTSLRGAMFAFLKPSEEGKKILDAYEISVEDIKKSIDERGLIKTFVKLRETFKNNDEELAKIIGSVEGLNAVLGLTGERAGETEQILRNISDGVGVVGDAFADVSATTEQKFNVAMANLQKIGLEIATELLPQINSGLGALNDILKNLTPEIKSLKDDLGALNTIDLGTMVEWFDKIGSFKIGLPGAFAGILSFFKELFLALKDLITGVSTLEQYLIRLANAFEHIPIIGKFFADLLRPIVAADDALIDFSRAQETVASTSDDLRINLESFSRAQTLMFEQLKAAGYSAAEALDRVAESQIDLFDPVQLTLFKQLKDAGFSTAEAFEYVANAGKKAGKGIGSIASPAKIATKELEKMVEHFRSLTKESASKELDLMVAALNEVGSGATYTEDGVASLIKKAKELAVTAGRELPEAFRRLEEKFSKTIEYTSRFGREILDVTPHVATLQDHLDALGNLADLAGDEFKEWGEVILNFTPQVRAAGDQVNNATDGMEKQMISAEKTAQSIEELAAAFQLLGLNATSALGSITIGLAQLARAIPAIKDFRKSILGDDKGDNFARGLSAAAEGIAAIGQATQTGSQAKRAAGGALAGASAGGQIGGPIGAAIGAGVGALVGWLRGRGPAKVMKEIGQEWGLKISQGLAEQISKIADELKLSKIQAAMVALGAIIREQGGLSEKNLVSLRGAFNDLLENVAKGAIPVAEGYAAINDAFGEMVTGLEKLGIKGSFEIGRLIAMMRELGVVTDEVQQFIADKAQSAIEHLGKYFSYLAKQENLTAEQAKNALTVMAGAFQAAIQAAGSLVGAMALLGDDFGELLKKMRGVLGDNNALLNAMQRYYNFVQNNQEQLAALDALAQAFAELAELNIVNKNNIDDFAQSFKDQFEDILGKTKDQNAALAAMGPQIAMLMEAYRELGLDVPEWLANLAQQAKEAGASLEPPEGLPDILKDIRDILYGIAEAFGVAALEADKFGRAAGNAADEAARNKGPDAGGGGRDSRKAQGGLHEMLKRDTTIFAHAGELASIIPRQYASLYERLIQEADEFAEQMVKQMHVPGYQAGGYVPASPPFGSLIRVGEREPEYVIPRSKMGGTTTVNVTMPIHFTGISIGNPEEIARHLEPGVRQMLRQGRLGQTLQDAVN